MPYKKTKEIFSVNETKSKSASERTTKPENEPLPQEPPPVLCCPTPSMDPCKTSFKSIPPELTPTPNITEEGLAEISFDPPCHEGPNLMKNLNIKIGQNSLAFSKKEGELVKYFDGNINTIPVIKPHSGVSWEDDIPANLGVDMTPKYLGTWKGLQHFWKIRTNSNAQKQWGVHSIVPLYTFSLFLFFL